MRRVTDMVEGIIRPDMDMAMGIGTAMDIDTGIGITDDTGIIIEGITTGGMVTAGITTMDHGIFGAARS